MGYLNYVELDENGVTVKDVSELSFADTVETMMSLGELNSTMKFLCAVCLKEKKFGQVCC